MSDAESAGSGYSGVYRSDSESGGDDDARLDHLREVCSRILSPRVPLDPNLGRDCVREPCCGTSSPAGPGKVLEEEGRV